jgi:hypothetical protein
LVGGLVLVVEQAIWAASSLGWCWLDVILGVVAKLQVEADGWAAEQVLTTT